MKKIKNNKIIALFITISSFVAVIGSGYSKWVLKEPIGNQAGTPFVKDGSLDEVYENYRFSNHVYELYFFPQSATTSTPKLNDDQSIVYQPEANHTGTGENDYGHWDSDSNVVGNRNDKFGYKHLTVNVNPSSEQMSSLGTLSIEKRGPANYPMRFIGWTADKAKSIEYISNKADYKNPSNGASATLNKEIFSSLFNSEFHLVDLTKSLEQYDNGEDGTGAGDHIIFLYAVYGTGKNSSNMTGSADQPVVRLEGTQVDTVQISPNKYDTIPSETYYFSQNWDSINGIQQGPYDGSFLPTRPLGSLDYRLSYYSLTGFQLNANQKYFLTFNLPNPSNNAWSSNWYTLNWDTPQINNDTTSEATPRHFETSNTVPLDNPNDDDATTPAVGPYFLEAVGDDAEGVNKIQDTRRNSSQTFLSTQPGLYNIYVLLAGKKNVSTGDASPVNNTQVNGDFFNKTLDPTKNIFEKTARYVRLFDNGVNQGGKSAIRPKVSGGEPNFSLTAFIKIEKVEEPYLVNPLNSNSFNSPQNGLKMIQAGTIQSDDQNIADSKIKTILSSDGHGAAANIRAVDYYAFNYRPINSAGEKFYITAPGEQLDQSKWISGNYMAFSTTTMPIKSNYLLHQYNMYEPLSNREITQINNYTNIKGQYDFSELYGIPEFQTTDYKNSKSVNFTNSVAVTPVDKGGNNIDTTNFGSGLASTYNPKNFFKLNAPTAGDAAKYDFDSTEYHIVLRLYYVPSSPNNSFNNYVLSGISVIAIPLKIRRNNSFYLITAANEQNIVYKVGNSGFIDLEKTVNNWKNNGGYYYSQAVKRTESINGDTLLMSSSDGQINSNLSYAQLLARLGATQAHDFFRKDSKYPANYNFTFDRARILVIE